MRVYLLSLKYVFLGRMLGIVLPPSQALNEDTWPRLLHYL